MKYDEGDVCIMPIAEVVFEKMWANNMPAYRIAGFRGVLRQSELPSEYLAPLSRHQENGKSYMSFHATKRSLILAAPHPILDEKYRITDDAPSFVYKISIGDVISIGERNTMVEFMRSAGNRLAKITKKSKSRARWGGEEVVKI